MDSNMFESVRSKSILGMNNSSHVISNSATSIFRQGKNIAATIRIVHVIEPKLIKTDPANFRALVQKLTGRRSKRSSRSSFKKSRQNMMNTSVNSYTSDQREFSDYNLKQEEFLGFLGISGTSFAEVKSESIEEEMKTCDYFARPFGGFAELDMLATQLDSGSELHILDDDPTITQIDNQRDVLKTSEIGGGFSSFL